jgi:3-oxoacyl-[acyl-carrier protein] reductase
MRLKDKVALVTGASGGLGGAICEAFAQEGAHCLVVFRSDREEAEKTAAKVRALGGRAEIHGADVSDEAQVQEMVAATEKTFGRLDIVVANAGLGMAKPLLETTLADFEKLLRTNLIGTYLTVRHGAQLMAQQKGGGKIITMASVHGLGGTHGCSLYAASKAGIINFTRGAAFDLAEFNIQVNAIAPGAVPVPKDPPPEEGSELHEAWMRYTPLGRFGKPQDVARTAVFLASSDSDWITGQVIGVDGGITAGPLIPSFKHYGPKPKME